MAELGYPRRRGVRAFLGRVAGPGEAARRARAAPRAPAQGRRARGRRRRARRARRGDRGRSRTTGPSADETRRRAPAGEEAAVAPPRARTLASASRRRTGCWPATGSRPTCARRSRDGSWRPRRSTSRRPDVARWRPLSDARWGAPIVRELAIIATVASITTYLVVVVLGVALAGREVTDPSGPGACRGGVRGGRGGGRHRRRASAGRAVVRVGRMGARHGPLPMGNAWLRARHAGARGGARRAPGSDRRAVAQRTGGGARRPRPATGARRPPRGWSADTPTAAAAIARHMVNLDSLRGRPADPAAALAAAAGIPDATARANATALVHIDTANREARAGRSPVPALRAARRSSGPAQAMTCPSLATST